MPSLPLHQGALHAFVPLVVLVAALSAPAAGMGWPRTLLIAVSVVVWLAMTLFAQHPTNDSEPMTEAPLCKVCDRGHLERKHVYRLGGVVAFIGYVILVPSVIFMGLTIGLVIQSYTAVAAETDPEKVQAATGAAAILTVFGGGAVLSALVGSLLGWILVLKKRLLQCRACGATVAAS